jgi:hypothetical protein
MPPESNGHRRYLLVIALRPSFITCFMLVSVALADGFMIGKGQGRPVEET